MIFADNTSIFDTVIYHFRSKEGAQVLPYDFTLRVLKKTKVVFRSANPKMKHLEGMHIEEVFKLTQKDYEFTGTI